MAIGHFAAPFAGNHQHRANAAINIHRTIAPRGPGQRVQGVKLFLALRDVERERLQHLGALMKRHGAERRATSIARPIQHGLHVQWCAAGLCNLDPGYGSVDRARCRPRFDPAGVCVTGRSQHRIRLLFY